MPSRGALRLSLDTYIVEPYAVVRKGVRVPEGKDLLVGHYATIEGPAHGANNVHLARGARIRGRLSAAFDVVLGGLAAVDGDVEAGGNVVLQEGARVHGRVKAGGRLRVIGATVEGPVDALGDVEVRGEAVLGEIRAGGRIRTLPPPSS